MIFSQPYLAVCSMDQVSIFIQGKRLEEVFPWKGNSLWGGINNFTSPVERGMRSYLQHTSAQSQAISLGRNQQADFSAPAQMLEWPNTILPLQPHPQFITQCVCLPNKIRKLIFSLSSSRPKFYCILFSERSEFGKMFVRKKVVFSIFSKLGGSRKNRQN